MKKRSWLAILTFVFALGTIVAALPVVKAPEPPVSIYIKDPVDGDNIYPGLPPPATKLPFPPYLTTWDVYISSPLSWMGTSDGIVAYLLSVRVDPRAAELYDFWIDTTAYTTFLELHAVYMGLATSQAPASKDIASGTMWGFGNGIAPLPTVGGGGDPINGDDEMLLARIRFYSNSETQASPIDLMGPGSIVDGIDVSVQYQNGRGEIFFVEPGDGWYVGETPPEQATLDEMFDPYDPQNPLGSMWHEVFPVFCQEWEMVDWADGGDGVLSESDQIWMQNQATMDVVEYHVDWVNEAPEGGDGKADMICTAKEIGPEFPLGIEILMILAPLMAIIYLYRRKGWKK